MKTRIGIDRELRVKVGSILSKELINFINLSLDLKQAHWMVKSREFKSLHQLFDDLHQMAEDGGDLIAERMIQLGVPTQGTAQSVAMLTTFDKYNEQLTDGVKHVDAILDRIINLAVHIREDLKQVQDLGDPGSADILTKISLDLDKAEWMLEATAG